MVIARAVRWREGGTSGNMLPVGWWRCKGERREETRDLPAPSALGMHTLLLQQIEQQHFFGERHKQAVFPVAIFGH